MRRIVGYGLVGHEPIALYDIEEWGRTFESLRRDGAHIVAQEYVGPTLVSTVFIGIDYNWHGGVPILFETMTFDTASDVQDRYATWDEARAGHDKVVAWLIANLVGATN